jgi:ABC-type antimicrobial peptide transport system permease subunit
VLAAIAAAIVVFMSSRTRSQELALLQASGATHRTIILTATLEAVIYVITAGILAFAIIVASGVIIAAGLSTAVPGTTAKIDATPGIIIAGIGCALILLATLGPTLVGLRRDVMHTLSAE